MGIKSKRGPKPRKSRRTSLIREQLESEKSDEEREHEREVRQNIERMKRLRVEKNPVRINGARVNMSKSKRKLRHRIHVEEFRKRIDAFLYITPHLNVNNDIRDIEITFANRKRIRIDNPNNFIEIKKNENNRNRNKNNNYSIRYIEDTNCFIINRRGLDEREEYVSLDEDIPSFAMMRKGSRYERKVKADLLKKCLFQPSKDEVVSIVFHLRDGTIWDFKGAELYLADRYFYLINGEFENGVRVDTKNNVPFDAKNERDFNPDSDKPRSRAQSRMRTRHMRSRERSRMMAEHMRTRSRSKHQEKNTSSRRSRKSSVSSGRAKRSSTSSSVK